MLSFASSAVLGVIVAALAAIAVSAADPPAGTAPHHRDGRFQNNYLEFEPKGIARAAEVAHGGGARRPAEAACSTATPRVAADLAFLRGNAVAGAAMVPALTWIGHASTLIQAGGANILTDPIFSERASPFGFVGPKRHVAAGAGARRAAAHRRRASSRTTTTTISTRRA